MENAQASQVTEKQKAFTLKTLDLAIETGRFTHAQGVFSYLLTLYVADQQELAFNESLAENYREGIRVIQDLLSVTSM